MSNPWDKYRKTTATEVTEPAPSAAPSEPARASGTPWDSYRKTTTQAAPAPEVSAPASLAPEENVPPWVLAKREIDAADAVERKRVEALVPAYDGPISNITGEASTLKDRLVAGTYSKPEDKFRYLQSVFGEESVNRLPGSTDNFVIRDKDGKLKYYNEPSWIPSLGDMASIVPELASAPVRIGAGLGAGTAAGPVAGAFAQAAAGEAVTEGARKGIQFLDNAFSQGRIGTGDTRTVKEKANDYLWNTGLGGLFGFAASPLMKAGGNIAQNTMDRFLVNTKDASTDAVGRATGSLAPSGINATEASLSSIRNLVPEEDQAKFVIDALGPSAKQSSKALAEVASGSIENRLAEATRATNELGARVVDSFRPANTPGTLTELADDIATTAPALRGVLEADSQKLAQDFAGRNADATVDVTDQIGGIRQMLASPDPNVNPFTGPAAAKGDKASGVVSAFATDLSHPAYRAFDSGLLPAQAADVLAAFKPDVAAKLTNDVQNLLRSGRESEAAQLLQEAFTYVGRLQAQPGVGQSVTGLVDQFGAPTQMLSDLVTESLDKATRNVLPVGQLTPKLSAMSLPPDMPPSARGTQAFNTVREGTENLINDATGGSYGEEVLRPTRGNISLAQGMGQTVKAGGDFTADPLAKLTGMVDASNPRESLQEILTGYDPTSLILKRNPSLDPSVLERSVDLIGARGGAIDAPQTQQLAQEMLLRMGNKTGEATDTATPWVRMFNRLRDTGTAPINTITRILDAEVAPAAQIATEVGPVARSAFAPESMTSIREGLTTKALDTGPTMKTLADLETIVRNNEATRAGANSSKSTITANTLLMLRNLAGAPLEFAKDVLARRAAAGKLGSISMDELTTRAKRVGDSQRARLTIEPTADGRLGDTLSDVRMLFANPVSTLRGTSQFSAARDAGLATPLGSLDTLRGAALEGNRTALEIFAQDRNRQRPYQEF